MKFALLFSGGKDCIYTYYLLTKQGHECACLLVGLHDEKEFSFIHALNTDFFEQYSQTLGVPIVYYHTKDRFNFYDTLSAFEQAKKYGAEAISSGIIDTNLENSIVEFVKKNNYQVKFLFPLSGRNSKDVVLEEIEALPKIMILFACKDILSSYVGKLMDKNFISFLEKNNLDCAGVFGEYHSLVLDAPFFKFPIKYSESSHIVKLKKGSIFFLIPPED